MTEYGRIHTDGSRSGGQPAQGYGVVTAANYISPIGGAGVVTHGVVGVAAQSDALREKVARAIMLHHDIDPDVFIGMHGGYDHWLNAADAALAAINEIPRQPTQNDARMLERCQGCGSIKTLEELRAAEGVISCCPERKMVKPTQSDALREENERLREQDGHGYDAMRAECIEAGEHLK